MSHRTSPPGHGATTAAASPGSRAGFSLVELTIVVLLGTLLLAAAYQVLVTNQRTYTVSNERIQAQQTVRAALHVLTTEFREVGAAGGDILDLDDDTIVVRALRGAAIVCSVDAPGNKILVHPVPPSGGLRAEDSVFVFADNDTELRSDDVWLRGKSGSVGNSSCPDGTSGQLVNLPGWSGMLTADSVRIGGPVRSYATYTYGAMPFDGEVYLGRQQPGGVAQPLIGPLRTGTGLTFTYFDSLGVETAVADDVRRIQVVLRTPQMVEGAAGEPVSDSVTVSIYTRN